MVILDPVSKRTLGRFAVCGLFIVVWYAACLVRGVGQPLALMASAAGVAVATVAVMRNEQQQPTSLTRWDEAMTWFGIAAFARLMAL